ncbi:hypothetical protein BT93_G2022 [Corymbia citriodora subsp. variegata]|nr:hypothetical protein BT93_G2022 [Corymbia citriodora subsp. variegata]
MSGRSQVSPSLQSIKSLPGQFKFMDTKASDHLAMSENLQLGSGDAMSPRTLGNGTLGDRVAEGAERSNSNVDTANEDSPYGRSLISGEERPSIGDEDSEAVASPLPSTSTSRSERIWGDMTPYASKKKLQSWFQTPIGDWELVKILSTSGVETLVSLPEGKVFKVKEESLLPANPDILDGVDDLMQLSYLNEPSVLYNLQYRYNQDMIYTKAGPVLVAINPFKKVPLYGNNYIEAYKNKRMESPHVYAITDTAIREMRRDEVNQSIIISYGFISLFLQR